MNDIAKANRIIDLYANDLEGLTIEECVGEGYNHAQSQELILALGYGKQGVVDEFDVEQLKSLGFSREFIRELRGEDGLKALNKRVWWLTNGPLLLKQLVDQSFKSRLEAETKDIGTAKVRDVMVGVLKQKIEPESIMVVDQACSTLAKMGEEAAPSIPFLIPLLSVPFGEVRRNAAYTLGQIGAVAHDALPYLESMAKNDPVSFNKKIAADAIEKITLGADR